MKAFVTGIAGFIGAHVAQHLLDAGWEVSGIDDLSGGRIENVPTGAEFRQIDCNDSLDELLQPIAPTAVFHLAAYAAEGLSHHIPVFNYQNNVVATANVLGAACRANVEHFVFTSSIAAYGHPKSGQPFDERTPCHPCDPYGTAKLACEHHIQSVSEYFGGPRYTIFRPHNVFGPQQNIADPYRNVVGIFIRRALDGQPFPVFGDGSQTRSFSYIDSVAACIAAAPTTEQAVNQTFNVGGDQPMSVRELGETLAEVMAIEPAFEFLPPRQEVQHAHASHAKVRSVFPAAFENEIDIRTGLERMVAYVRQHSVPEPTPCPSAIEISDKLPPSWR
ncbi:MAG: NAD-dependent epimerase/dehydratase family protein [Planctomycetaceae bacterium]|nr:NAD-dependent epimerase/dehydratase family protein [Planctomycetaceae bacterium]MCA9110799.1 NAD-dependent epimerase/dehydratase family protein [Planctomycetaceae bacterium]